MDGLDNQLCTFVLGNADFAIEVSRVQEVLRAQEMTSIPLAPEVVSGLINLRGQIVTAYDMRRRMNFTPRAHDEDTMNIVVNTADGAVSFIVDEIGDVIEVDLHDVVAPPATIPANYRSLIKGVLKQENRLLLILDSDKICTL